MADTHLPLARWHLLRIRASRAALLGRLEEARAWNKESGALAEVQVQDPSARGLTSAFRLCMATLTGDPAELGEEWLTNLADAPDIPILVACTASAMILLDRPDEASLLYQRMLPLLPDLPRDGPVAGDDGRPRRGGRADRRHRRRKTPPPPPASAGPWSGGPGAGNMWASGAGWRPVARMAAVAGWREEARTAFEQALTADVRIGARPDAVHVRLRLAELLAQDDLSRAVRLATEAAAAARRLGMPGSLRRADSLLAVLSSAAPDPLSPRERSGRARRAVLENREVAKRHVLSERTVESHVRSILAKLGLTRRTDVVRWVLGDRASV